MLAVFILTDLDKVESEEADSQAESRGGSFFFRDCLLNFHHSLDVEN